MNNKKYQIIFLIVLIVILFLINYSWMDSYFVKSFNKNEENVAERVIDGDTIVAEGKSIRLLG